MKKILLIEDNKGITEGLCDTFTEPEYELLTAGNLKEAGVLLSEHPGLVLLDVSLPDGNGFDFYSERLEKEKHLQEAMQLTSIFQISHSRVSLRRAKLKWWQLQS